MTIYYNVHETFSLEPGVLLNVAMDMECLAFPNFLIHPPLPPCLCCTFSATASPSPPSPASLSPLLPFAFTVVGYVFCGACFHSISADIWVQIWGEK